MLTMELRSFDNDSGKRLAFSVVSTLGSCIFTRNEARIEEEEVL